ncbi:MAG: site-2 protease family protein, partial [Acidobacteriaceae bacterium]
MIIQAVQAHASVDRGIALAVLMLVAVGLHEIGHVIAAGLMRVRLRLILLMPLGGVSFYGTRKRADASQDPAQGDEKRFLSPRQETIIALAGPLASLLVAGAAILYISATM